mgnify:CR=1 FL=1
MKRGFLTLLAVLLCLGGVGVVWLGFTASGLEALAAAAARASGGRLSIAQPSGRLLAGDLAVERLAWREPDLAITVSGLRVAWSPAALLDGRLAIAAASAARVEVDSASSDQEGMPPASLQLPFAVDVERLAISQFAIGPLFVVDDVAARYAADAGSHRLEQLRARYGKTELSAAVVLGALAPFPVQLQAELHGRLEDKAVRLALSGDGPLARIAVKAVAAEGLRGDGAAILTPFARHAFGEARLSLVDLDPAAWLAGAPGARLAVHARVQPDPEESGVLGGEFSVANAVPGLLDRQRLPLEKLGGRFDWRNDVLRLADLNARLPGGGRLTGEGRWQDGQLALELRATALDLARVAAVMRPTRLGGPLTATIGPARQVLACQLADGRFTLALDARHENGRLGVPRLELAAGDSSLKASGELAMHGEMKFAVSGELARFDPSRFARLPAALVNAVFSASGRLAPQPIISAQFALRDSRLAGQPLAGRGDLLIDWPRIPKAEVELTAGANRLQARGAFGRPGDSLRIELAAPTLAPYGVAGGVTGYLQLGGTLEQATLAGELQAAKLGLPGIGAISDARLVADLASAPDSPLRIEARVAAVDAAGWPGLLRQFTLQVSGSRRQHSLQLATEIAGNNRLTLRAEGGLAAELRQPAWTGRLLAARLEAELAQRSFVLGQPAALDIGGTAWKVGPLLLDGDAWQLRGQAAATQRQLRAEFSGRGPRIGQLSGQLDAALRDAPRMGLPRASDGFIRLDRDGVVTYASPNALSAFNRMG